MRRRTQFLRTLCLAAALALLCLAGFAALAEEKPLYKAKYSEIVTTQENVWVEIPADSSAASWDVSLWKLGPAWERIYSKDNVTAAGRVTLETKDKLAAGVYALRVAQYDARDVEQATWQEMVSVCASRPAKGEVRLTLTDTRSSTGGGGVGVAVDAPGATGGILVMGQTHIDFKGDHINVQIGFGEPGSKECYAIVHYADGTHKTTAKQTVTVADDAGTLGDWKPTGLVSGEIAATAAITLHIPPVANAAKITADGKTNVYYEVNITDQTADATVVEENFKTLKDPGDRGTVKLIGSGADVSVPAGKLVAGHNYGCFVQASASGYGYAYQYSRFTARGSTDSKLTLTISGKSSGSLKMGCGEDFNVQVKYPKDATAIRVYCGDHFEYMYKGGWWDDSWERTNTIDIDWSIWDKDSYVFYAQAYYKAIPEGKDPEALDWGSAASNSVTVTAENSTHLPIPAFSVSQTKVARGDMIVVTVTNKGSGAEGVNAYIESLDSDRGYYDFQMRGNAIRIPTAALEAGTYRLTVENYAKGKWGSSAYELVTVTEPTVTGKPVLSLGSTEIPTHEQARIQAYAKGAERLDVYIYRSNGEQDEHRDYDGDTVDDRFGGYDEPGTFTVMVVADYGQSTAEATATFEVKADKGALKLATVTSAPETVKAGEDVTVKFTADPKAGWCYIDAHRIVDGDWQHIFGTDIDADAGKITLDGDLFSEPGAYNIGIHSNQDGYESSHVWVFFQVVKESKKPTLSLTVNGSTKATSVATGERFRVEVKAPGATALRVRNDNGDWDYRWKDDRPEYYNEIWEIGDNRIATLYAEASYDKKYNPDDPDSLNWSAVSNGVKVTATAAKGRLGAIKASLSADSVNQGGKLTLKVDPLSASGKLRYGAHIQRKVSEDNYDHLFTVILSSAAGSVDLPTNILEAGDYRVVACAWGEGYTESNTILYFTLKKADQKKVLASVSKTKAKTYEEVFIAVKAKGADSTEFRITRKNDKDWDDRREWDGDTVEEREYGFPKSGTYTVTPIGHYGNKEVKGDAVTVTVTSSGKLANLKLDCPSVILLGKPFKGSFKTVKGAERYHFNINWAPSGEDWEYRDSTDLDAKETAFAFDSGIFAEPGRYHLEATAVTVGKDSEEVGHFFAVVDPDKILKLPAKLKKIEKEAFMGVDAQMIVVPKGVKSIDARAFADCPNLLAVIVPDSVKQVADNAFEGCERDPVIANAY